MTPEQKAKFEAIANGILSALAVINPAAGVAAKALQEVALARDLFGLGTEFSDLLNEVREESDATAEQVGGDVSAAYIANRDKMLASFAEHPGS
jgi:hypothetical protein